MATITENIQTLQSIKSDIKNAIIQKGGSVTDAFGGYAQAITNLPSGGGGGTEIEDALIMRTLSDVYYNNRVSMVGSYVFHYNTKLKSVDLPNCISIREYAFTFCSKLASVNIPNCTYISNNAFANTALFSVNLPNCSYVGDRAFEWCLKLLSVNLPNCKSFGKGYFGDSSTFAYCSALSIVNIPLCSYIGNKTFQDCTNLKEVYLNSVSNVATISSNTFSNCPKLTSVYVPASLVNAFKTAPNWSSISSKIVAYTGA